MFMQHFVENLKKKRYEQMWIGLDMAEARSSPVSEIWFEDQHLIIHVFMIM